MKGIVCVLVSIIIFVVLLLLTLLIGHTISYFFGYGWALSDDNKGACAVIGSIIGVIGMIAFWCTMDDAY